MRSRLAPVIVIGILVIAGLMLWLLIAFPKLGGPVGTVGVVLGTAFTAFAAYGAWRAAEASRAATAGTLRRERHKLEREQAKLHRELQGWRQVLQNALDDHDQINEPRARNEIRKREDRDRDI